MEKNIKKKLILHISIGFIIGALVGILIPMISSLASTGDFSEFMEYALLTAKIGKAGAIIVQLIISGLFGCVCVGGMLLYEIEKWSLALATFVHYISIMAVFTAASFGLGWFSESLIAYFIAVSCETVGFAIIWIIMYSQWKKTVKEINEDLEKYKKDKIDKE